MNAFQKRLSFVALIFFCSSWNLFAQNTTVVFKPGPTTGKDAYLHELSPNNNNSIGQDLGAWTWTFGGTPGSGRTLIEFDLTSIPTNATVVTATLSLFYNPNSTNQGQAGANAAWLQRVTAPWTENTVTWATQPTVTTANQISLAQSTTSNQSYPNINVTSEVQDMVTNPSANHGWLFRLQVEQTFASMKFGSSDNADSTLWPELFVEYSTTPPPPPDSSDTCMTYRPDWELGKDAYVDELNPNKNYATYQDYGAWAWTFGGNPGIGRSLLEFDLSSIPQTAVIDTALISLYHNPNSTNAGQSGANAAYLQRITSSWSESTVTWNTQPTTSTNNQVTLVASSSGTQNYIDQNVTALVQDMISSPSTSHGFMLKLQVEQILASMKFASSDHTNSSLHPQLYLCYTDTNTIINHRESVLEKSVEVFPNPAGDKFTISLTLYEPLKLSAKLVSLDGKENRQLFKNQGQIGYQEILIERSELDLANGFYVLVFRAGEKEVRKKIILTD